MTTPSLVVLGPGAIGGLVAALLERAGHRVTVVGRPATVAQVAAHGLAVDSDRVGSWESHPAADTEIPPGAAVVVAVKAAGVGAAVEQLGAADPVPTWDQSPVVGTASCSLASPPNAGRRPRPR